MSMLPTAVFATTIDRVTTLESEIMAIAEANQTRVDNLREVRAQLRPLVDELLNLVPQRTQADVLPDVVGSWHCLWSSQRFGSPSTSTVDFTQVYQVVFSEGYYWNVARKISALGSVETSFLRGQFEDRGDFLDIEFTDTFSAPAWFGPGADLVTLGIGAEVGAITGRDDSMDGPFSPIGMRGTLANAYASGKLRIVVGGGVDDDVKALIIFEREKRTLP